MLWFRCDSQFVRATMTMQWCLPLPHGAYPSHMVLTPPTWCLPPPHGAYPSHMVLTPPTWCLPLPHGAYPSHMVLIPPPHGAYPSTWCLSLPHGAYPSTWCLPLPHGAYPSHMVLTPPTWCLPLPHGAYPSHMGRLLSDLLSATLLNVFIFTLSCRQGVGWAVWEELVGTGSRLGGVCRGVLCDVGGCVDSKRHGVIM